MVRLAVRVVVLRVKPKPSLVPSARTRLPARPWPTLVVILPKLTAPVVELTLKMLRVAAFWMTNALLESALLRKVLVVPVKTCAALSLARLLSLLSALEST